VAVSGPTPRSDRLVGLAKSPLAVGNIEAHNWFNGVLIQHCLKQYWPLHCGMSTVFLGQTRAPKYPEIDECYTTTDVPWSTGLINFLETNCTADYILNSLEDCLLIRPANAPEILRIVSTMKASGIQLVKLYLNRNLVPYVAENHREHGLIKCSSDMQFSVSFFPSIWRKDLLLSVLRRNINPWLSERRGSGVLQKAAITPYYCDTEPFPFREVIRRGKLKPSCERFIRNLHIPPTIYRPFHFKPKSIDCLTAAGILRDAVERIQCHYWLSAGTALGLYRDGRLIPGDTDVDIAIEGFPDILNVLQKRLSGYRLFRYAVHAFHVTQMAFEKDGACLDVYIYWPDKRYLVNVGEFGRVMFPSVMLRNTVPLKTQYGTFNMPSPPEEYLRIKYGDDWCIPQSKKGLFYEV
jgi:hypothetical protein